MTVGTSIVAAVAGTFVFGFVVFGLWWFVRKRNINNDINHGRHPPGYGAVDDELQNPIGENPAGRSQPMPIGASCAKADVNVISERVLETS